MILQDDFLELNDVGVRVESPESLDLPEVVHLLDAKEETEGEARAKVEMRCLIDHFPCDVITMIYHCSLINEVCWIGQISPCI